MENFIQEPTATFESPSTMEQRKKLFIGGLNSTTHDDQLKEYCSKFGETTECLIIRDKVGRSRSFAFVSFREISAVEEFMKNRPHIIDGRKSEVRRAMPRYENTKFDSHSSVKKIFIGAIPVDLNDENLKKYFESFGNIVECHIMKDNEEKSRGFGFVTFDDYDSVDRCILEKPHVLQGREIDVQKAIPREQFPRTRNSLRKTKNFGPPLIGNYPNLQGPIRGDFSKPLPLMNAPSTNFVFNPNFFPTFPVYAPPFENFLSNRIKNGNRILNKPRNSHSNGSSSNNNEHNRKLFIGGLSSKTTDETLKNYVLKFGELTDCLVMKDQNGHSKCFGFVTFVNGESVEEFMKDRPHRLDGRQIDPKRAMPREEAQNDDIHLTVKKIFLGGIRDGLNEKSLRDYFQQFGNIVECLLMQSPEGKLRGFAFIEFDDYDSVDKVILARPHVIGEHRIDVKKAIPRENRFQSSKNNFSLFDMTINGCYVPLNPLFSSNFFSPTVPLLNSYGTTGLSENFSRLHLSTVPQSNIHAETSRESQ